MNCSALRPYQRAPKNLTETTQKMTTWSESLKDQIDLRNKESDQLQQIFSEYDNLFQISLFLMEQRDKTRHKVVCIEYQTQELKKQETFSQGKLVEYFQQQLAGLYSDMLPFEYSRPFRYGSFADRSVQLSKTIFEQQGRIKLQQEECDLAKSQLKELIGKNVALEERNVQLEERVNKLNLELANIQQQRSLLVASIASLAKESTVPTSSNEGVTNQNLS